MLLLNSDFLNFSHMNNYIKQYGIVILLDALGTCQLIITDLDG
jgi:hypothetical protein